MREFVFNLEDLVDAAFEKAEIDNRSQKIVEKRFGLLSAEPETLQELGDHYGITRERVRQVESQAVKELRQALLKIEETEKLVAFISDYLASTGGVRKDEVLVAEVYKLFKAETDEEIFGNKLRFILQLLEKPYYFRENENYHSFWYAEKEIYQVLESIHGELVSRLKQTEEFLDLLKSIIEPHKLNEPIALNYISVSKKIGVGPYGDFGLSHWDEVNPKTVRAKIYLALKKSGRPLHFTEIAKIIDSHAPTVHNELIKDREKFILVSRGTYSLK